MHIFFAFLLSCLLLACGDDGESGDPATTGTAPGVGCGSVDLASTIDPASRIAEVDLTGSQARIEFGDGTPGDFDGIYDVNDPSIMYGAAGRDIFPREGAFVVGSLTYGTGETCESGTFPVTSLDLSELWETGSNTTDIAGEPLSIWLFASDLAMRFGELDSADTVTVVDGVPTSVDVEVAVEFEVDYAREAGDPSVYNGTLTFSGNTINLALDDTITDIPTPLGTQPRSQMIFAIAGTVNAVSPE